MSPAAVAGQVRDPGECSDQRQAGDQRERRLRVRGEGDQTGTGHSRDVARRQHRNPAEPVHGAPGEESCDGAAGEEDRGAEPSRTSTPVTRTNVIVAIAAPSCSIPETVASDAARRIVFRVTGGAGLAAETELTGVFHQPRPEGGRTTVRRVPDAADAEG